MSFLTKIDIQRHVISTLGSLVTNVISFVEAHDPYFWSTVKSRGYLRTIVMVILHKDITGLGYCELSQRIKRFLPLSSKTLDHNAQVLRPILKDWAVQQIELRDSADWCAAARGASLPELVKDANLWMDSSDFPMKKFKGYSTKGSEHSLSME
jgi:hypothetical protein